MAILFNSFNFFVFYHYCKSSNFVDDTLYAGKNSFTWFGPIPRVIITDPHLVKDVLNNNHDFPKPNVNPLVRLQATGLVSLEGEKWGKHRRIINPTFNLEKLKVTWPLLAIALAISICTFVENTSHNHFFFFLA